jgi:hypothetical protein
VADHDLEDERDLTSLHRAVSQQQTLVADPTHVTLGQIVNRSPLKTRPALLHLANTPYGWLQADKLIDDFHRHDASEHYFADKTKQFHGTLWTDQAKHISGLQMRCGH